MIQRDTAVPVRQSLYKQSSFGGKPEKKCVRSYDCEIRKHLISRLIIAEIRPTNGIVDKNRSNTSHSTMDHTMESIQGTGIERDGHRSTGGRLLLISTRKCNVHSVRMMMRLVFFNINIIDAIACIIIGIIRKPLLGRRG
jgi:hypothetical protein